MKSYLGKSLQTALLLTVFFALPPASAEETPPAELTPEQEMAIKLELSKYAVLGQQQILHLTEQATDEYTATLTDSGPNLPSAWMLLEDGATVKRINIDEQAKDAPAQIRILMYRAALKSLARRGKIHGSVILYTGKIREGSDDEALVIEFEHRLGISGNKVVPYQVTNGHVTYSEPVTTEKPFQIFHDGKPESDATN
ncbi:hypothetical protein [Marinobacter xiaoshiensis]|uniref:Peptidoglycan-binding protein, CsiV n=1 Tax=Marinobacter xiaoshiensis TaxID=3073652 RepID=A0ABU2HHC9_9GAMM|nr:hypothetical protein [Marinobacter sp. F60267]MDS1310437.1 hypothetical protein [Marinobacter sp. F60267]